MTTNPTVRSICILRLSAIGDVTHMIPVVKSLQAGLPGVSITWVIGRLEHRLLQGLPGVDFIVFVTDAAVLSCQYDFSVYCGTATNWL